MCLISKLQRAQSAGPAAAVKAAGQVEGAAIATATTITTIPTDPTGAISQSGSESASPSGTTAGPTTPVITAGSLPGEAASGWAPTIPGTTSRGIMIPGEPSTHRITAVSTSLSSGTAGPISGSGWVSELPTTVRTIT